MGLDGTWWNLIDSTLIHLSCICFSWLAWAGIQDHAPKGVGSRLLQFRSGPLWFVLASLGYSHTSESNLKTKSNHEFSLTVLARRNPLAMVLMIVSDRFNCKTQRFTSQSWDTTTLCKESCLWQVSRLLICEQASSTINRQQETTKRI